MKLYTNILPQSERLIFRRLSLDDVDSWMEFFASEEALEFLLPMGISLNSPEDCIAWIERAKWRYETFGIGLWTLIEKHSGSLIGQCGLLVQEVEGKEELEIGYHLIPGFWKKGYAIEAAIACKNFAYKNNLSKSLISIVHIDNINSQKVAERNGMKREKQIDYKGIPVFVFRIREE